MQHHTLAERFDPRSNSLNLIRLILASFVIVWHSFPLSGTAVPWKPLRQFMENISVDGFFAISGFLIVSSWMNRPNWWQFLKARVLRIFPAFWVSLILTAFVIAPTALILSKALPDEYWQSAGVYVASNSLLWVSDYSIDGTPANVPFPGAWNGSMWTLFWEFLCYLGVLAAGLLGFLKRRWTIPILFAGSVVGVLATSYGPVGNRLVSEGAHFGILFLAGALIYQFRDRILVSRGIAAAAALVVATALWLPDYRIVAAIPVAYLMLTAGAVWKAPSLRNDLSYGTYVFGFPIQQALVMTIGASALGVTGLAVVALIITMAVAAGSWFLVEKPALRLKGGGGRTVQQLSVRQ